ncbi:MAG: HD domain-containing protein [Candidatus Sumerlaeia bacterium]|nr:HD domain-containing protein [Candidatus Sumerlaeia bacterium]
MLKLSCQTGILRGQVLDAPTRRLSVGRDPSCDLRIDDPKVSRLHGWLETRDGEFYFTDNKSTNGTFLNGERFFEGPIVLGDTFQLGACEFVVLEPADFQTIHFVASNSIVTNSVQTGVFRVDALADKFSEIFDYYKDKAPESGQWENLDIVRMQRMLNSLKTLFTVSQTISQLIPLKELLAQVAQHLFEVFPAGENLVILLRDEATGAMRPVHASEREGGEVHTMAISQTVLDQAVREKSTLIANDATADDRLSASDSIVGLNVKSVMCAPLIVGERVIGAMYIDNRQVSVRYDEMDMELVTAFANQAAVAIDNARLCDDLQSSYHQTLQALVNAIEAKDPYTMGHTARVAKLSTALGRELGLNKERLERLRMAAELHDIGKIGVKEGIINKAGKLTDEEYEDIKLHVEMGERILKPITFLADLLPHIRGHHEKWDGTGYPDGLKGEQCTLEGRIIAMADAFDAMTSQRSYNKPLTWAQALERIRATSGKHFDPRLVDAFGRMMDRQAGTGSGPGLPFPAGQELELAQMPQPK